MAICGWQREGGLRSAREAQRAGAPPKRRTLAAQHSRGGMERERREEVHGAEGGGEGGGAEEVVLVLAAVPGLRALGAALLLLPRLLCCNSLRPRSLPRLVLAAQLLPPPSPLSSSWPCSLYVHHTACEAQVWGRGGRCLARQGQEEDLAAGGALALSLSHRRH